MKRFAILAALAAAFLLSACASTQPAQQDPAVVTAKLVAQVKKACTVVQPTILSLQAQQAVLTADQLADLSTASTLADKVCTAAASATVEITSVSDFVQAAFPVIIKIVNAAPLDPANKAAASAALTVAQVAVSAALAQ